MTPPVLFLTIETGKNNSIHRKCEKPRDHLLLKYGCFISSYFNNKWSLKFQIFCVYYCVSRSQWSESSCRSCFVERFLVNSLDWIYFIVRCVKQYRCMCLSIWFYTLYWLNCVSTGVCYPNFICVVLCDSMGCIDWYLCLQVCVTLILYVSFYVILWVVLIELCVYRSMWQKYCMCLSIWFYESYWLNCVSVGVCVSQ